MSDVTHHIRLINTRAAGDGPRHFEPRSAYEDDIRDCPFSPKSHTTPKRTFQTTTNLMCVIVSAGRVISETTDRLAIQELVTMITRLLLLQDEFKEKFIKI
ncbi:hypothetical protein TNCV_1666081 [Trichonephila clavipes]|nr:hypothetical protein TNCV_1666081 [Trichonephila clavipes]